MMDRMFGVAAAAMQTQERMVKDLCKDVGLTEEFLQGMSVDEITEHLETINLGLFVNADSVSNMPSHIQKTFEEGTNIAVVVGMLDYTKDECISLLMGEVRLDEDEVHVSSYILNDDHLAEINAEYKEWRKTQ